EVQQVEAVQDRRGIALRGRNVALGLELHALLQRVERRPSLRVESDDLAVEHQAVDALLRQLRDQRREGARELEAAAAGLELDLAAADEHEHAVAVELGLPRPARIVE